MDPALRAAVEQRALVEDRPLTAIMRQALRRYLASTAGGASRRAGTPGQSETPQPEP
jgi:hypothetical protein